MASVHAETSDTNVFRFDQSGALLRKVMESAAVGMALGLVQYVMGKKHLQPAIDRIESRPKAKAADTAGTSGSLTADEWKRIAAIVVFFVFASIFWGAYEQAASTLSLFGDRYTRHEIFGFDFPSSWFQTVQPISVIILAPIFAWLWLRLGSREPSSLFEPKLSSTWRSSKASE